ncbi:pyridoxamine 5'-phosphate oxidase family protein [Streptomyces sp. RB6PN25]|uniref:Pyridoxamine 5'-phosphate oxidase family protein n=1 Tax=Streptomyces humicola TaxID=2953240 RepID=A0ABT1PSG8_9ACTN|nr:pyridoxamine 5'-phosphate oxidase family protein [Streptomyces humicola]MCQ4080628.1 pyridoxamine 5'-phosphate oxidase family protein [Streptomyces humicola]
MAEKAAPGGARGVSRLNPGDIGRRVAERRRKLGLSRGETAERAGMAANYLRYVEEQPADSDMGALLRLAGALDTTVSELLGGGVDLPPGTGRAGYHPQLVEMDREECRARLTTHGVGRVAVTTAAGPAILPVNYSVIDGAIVFRTAPDAAPAVAATREVAFEVDHVDEALSQGWSVLVIGEAEQVSDPESVRRLHEQAYSKPWAGGERDVWIRINPLKVTGRRIRVGT